MFRGLLRSVIGRLSVLLIGIAVIGGSVWSWRTAPWYLVSQQYFITVSPNDTYTQRGGRPFDVSLPFHRSLLISGPLPVPFGADPNTNLLLLERGADLDSPLATSDAKLYSQYCGFIDDKMQTERANWRWARLCNSGNLQGDFATAALAEFHNKADAEIAHYQSSVLRNAAAKFGAVLSMALGLLLVVAAGMWVAVGRLL